MTDIVHHPLSDWMMIVEGSLSAITEKTAANAFKAGAKIVRFDFEKHALPLNKTNWKTLEKKRCYCSECAWSGQLVGTSVKT